MAFFPCFVKVEFQEKRTRHVRLVLFSSSSSSPHRQQINNSGRSISRASTEKMEKDISTSNGRASSDDFIVRPKQKGEGTENKQIRVFEARTKKNASNFPVSLPRRRRKRERKTKIIALFFPPSPYREDSFGAEVFFFLMLPCLLACM